ncbi:MAG: response regulator [Candidatus Omnitrophica bacterium]|nr:response regulator [Candidatus Omnitrophota bacterium]
MESSSGKKRILIVDDDPVQLKLLEDKLSAQGYEVVPVSEADQGLQYAINSEPDIILLDVMMPVINGFNFCRLLKSEEKQKHIPIILVTSRDAEEDIKIGLEMGADAYVTKPVNFEKLLSTIKIIETGRTS